MKFTVDKKEQYSIFQLDEENLNSLNAPHLKSEFIFLRNENVQNLIFDMSKVKYVDSSGLSSILTANRLWSDVGSFIMVGVTSPNVKKLIEISRLDTILTIYDSPEKAIEFVELSGLEQSLSEEE